MKQNPTKCTVRLRKHDEKNSWYLYIEAYPVYVNGNPTPKRIREYLNRTITTPIFNKSAVARTDGKVKTFQPRRDVNGVIMCRTEVDNDTCLFADRRRNQLQHEYDNASLFSDSEAEQAQQLERSQQDFIAYFDKITISNHIKSSSAIVVNWRRVSALLKTYTNGATIPFANITVKMLEDFKRFLLSSPQGGGKPGTISQTTASTYFSILKAALKQAFVDEYLMTDLAAKVKNIPPNNVRRNYLTEAELNQLANTPCDIPVLKRAALFSALTGLRHCDIQKLQWSEVQRDGDSYRLNFTQQKTKEVEYMPISEQAYKLCGEPKEPCRLVFEDLTDAAWISKPLKRWLDAAGITRKITFHCFRHTFATLQLANGTDIYTVSKMLGHTNVKTTQIYAKVVNEKKEQAANAIKIAGL
ncbi:MAG: site-specific integrase [Candidatus Onthomorpha sp.]|nr:site-specific integrase [Bacteroidales bacterium]MCI6800044.1 site-specific integrase [Bacteroidales bacterium]MDY4862386.1 site-specific integrase [Candidatus Onthomorpha sp.]